ncbi:hypothetical protein [Olleya namhaensis]|uniref:hypothetical protein n=1 Tax=Olleya namhaensis TaxID=1144750 RepID=UPI002492F269|nr:hypothetical protein [Olleya namhaensis]
MKKIFFLLSLILILNSCKDLKKTERVVEPVEKKAKKVKENIYRLSLFGEFGTENRFSLWFVEDSNTKFNSKQYLSKKVSGIGGGQEVLFELKKNEILEKFRLRLAHNSENTEIKLDSLIISYNLKKLTIHPKEYLKYLKPNKYVELDTTSIIRFKSIEINKKVIFDPFIISNDKLNDELFNLY